MDPHTHTLAYQNFSFVTTYTHMHRHTPDRRPNTHTYTQNISLAII